MHRIIPNRLKSSSSFHSTKNGGSQAPSQTPSQAPSQAPSRSTSPRAHGHASDTKGNNITPLILRTVIWKGRNLAAKDRGGTSDPYIVVTLGDAKETTHAMSKTVNPEWNVSFDLPVVGVQSLLLECVCWDQDRFGKDYLGEIAIPLEDIFANKATEQEPRWYALESSHIGDFVSGEIQLQFSLVDPTNLTATPDEILSKFETITASAYLGSHEDEDVSKLTTAELEEAGLTTESEDLSKPEVVEKRRRRLRLARLKNRTKQRAYAFNGASDVLGIVYLEICRVRDLPPELNVTRTSFDMDPFVVTSLGKKTYRTKVVRHNLNPVYDEKLIFQVMRHEQNFSISFTVIDRDKLSGNDFIGSCSFPLETLYDRMPEADPETGLYNLPDPPDPTANLPPPKANRSRFRLPLSRSSSATSLNKMGRPPLLSRNSSSSNNGSMPELPPAPTSAPASQLTHFDSATDDDPSASTSTLAVPATGGSHAEQVTAALQAPSLSHTAEDSDLQTFTLPIALKNKDRWEDKHKPELFIRAKYVPYPALRQQFWRSMLKQYDADDDAHISKVELSTMLDTLGSTLRESTIDGFFQRFAEDSGVDDPAAVELTYDQAVMCLEDQLCKTDKQSQSSLGESLKNKFSSAQALHLSGHDTSQGKFGQSEETLNEQASSTRIPAIQVDEESGREGEEGDTLLQDDLGDETQEEHVVEIGECPLCHQPRLNKRSDADIITHIATCASQDWRQVNTLVMGGFVTSSQAQRKWYSKVMTKIGYGGYRLGANSANILVQDRVTGQINEERMSIYVRLGIRLLYKGLKSREMEKKRIRRLLKSLSIKQGIKYDDPASARDIQTFINFHQLNMDEVLLPLKDFKTFNQFFYRKLEPDARPCSAPDNPHIIVSPADCRSVVFNTIDDATKVWIKGREFTVERLLGKAYPEDAKRFVGGSLGIFRLAPQDYHRFHIPVDGVLGEPRLIEGEYYTVNPMAIRSALDVYGENIRVVVPIDSATHGRVMAICVGAMMVGSTVITREPGEKVSRAEELGYFKFGGSTIVLLFEPGAMKFDPDLVENSNGALETLIRVGMSIGHTPDHPPHKPDMRKENPTHEEKQEAKRKIEGSLAPARASTM